VTVVGIREVSLPMSVDLEVYPYSDYMYVPEILIGRMENILSPLGDTTLLSVVPCQYWSRPLPPLLPRADCVESPWGVGPLTERHGRHGNAAQY
jgi:hypothetical protein